MTECSNVKEYHPFRQGFWGIREGFTAAPLGESISSRNKNWSVVHTPGHSNDHVVLFNKETGILFSGDLLTSVKPKGMLPGESVSVAIESLSRVLMFDFQEMFCSHLGYVEDGKTLLRKKKEWLQDLQNEIIILYKQGCSKNEISQKLFPKAQPLISVSDHQWNPIHIINDVLHEVFPDSLQNSVQRSVEKGSMK
nr:MBL fold metallo-hydrolase [Domibacillus epiphyticus]